MGKRILSLLLAVVMCFSLLPVPAFAAQEPEVSAESVGETAAFSAAAAFNVTVVNGTAEFYDSVRDDTVSGSTISVPAGETVSIQADDPAAGMEFDHWSTVSDLRSDEYGAVNDCKWSWTQFDMPAADVTITAVYRTAVVKTPISSISLEVTPPVDGQPTADPYLTSGFESTCTITSSLWYIDGEEFTGRFEEGRTYSLSITLTPNEDYYFTDTASAYINGTEVTTVFKYGNDLVVDCRLTAEAINASTVLLYLAELRDGESVVYPVVGDYYKQYCSITESYWLYNGERFTGKCIAGQTYTLVAVLEPATGYRFTDTMVLMLNGSRDYISSFTRVGTGRSWEMRCDFEILSDPVSAFQLIMNHPDGDKAPPEISILGNDSFDAEYAWTCGGQPVIGNLAYESDYELTVTITADQGRLFTTGEGGTKFTWHSPDTMEVVSLADKVTITDLGKTATIVLTWSLPAHNLISAADITLTRPEIGANPDMNPVVPAGAHYTVTLEYWYLADGKLDYPHLTATDVFEENKGYCLRFDLVPDEGYYFDYSTVFTVNGETAGLYGLPGYVEMDYYVRQPVVLTNASCTIGWPEINGTADRNPVVPSGANYTVELENWYLSDSAHGYPVFSATDTFAAGNDYLLHVRFTPKWGYVFDDNTVFTINGMETGCFGTAGDRRVTIPVNEPEVITDAVCRLLRPQPGDGPQLYVSVSEDLNYTATLQELRDVTDPANPVILQWSDTFTSGNKYEYTVTFEPKYGYRFDTERTTFRMLLGNPESADCSEVLSPNGRLGECIFAFECVYPQTIEEASFTLTPPKAGAHPDMVPVVPADARYTVAVEWQLYDSSLGYPVLKETDVFEEGREYYLNIDFLPEYGYQFTWDTVFTFNGKTTYRSGVPGYEYALMNIPVPQLITTAECTVTGPVGGFTPDQNPRAAEDANYTVTLNYWYLDDTTSGSPVLAATDTFVADSAYGISLTFEPKENYRFDSTTVFKVNGINALSTGEPGKAVTATFLAPPLQKLPAASCTVKGPYAYWQPDMAPAVPDDAAYSVSVSYRDENGTVLTEDDTFAESSRYTMSLVFTPANGFIFDENTVVTVNDEQVTITVAGGKAYAEVTVELPALPRVTLTFNPNGGTGTMEPMEVISNQAIWPFPVCTFTAPKGMIFAGWTFRDDGEISQSTTAFTQDTELRAVWEKIGYYVTFNANGAEGDMSIYNGYWKPDTMYTLPDCSYSRPGFTFLGWSTSKSGAVTYTDNQTVMNLAKSGGKVTLYARWAANKYTIRFYNQGTFDTAADLTDRLSGKEYKLPANTFTRTGYVFAGWMDTYENIYPNKGKVKYYTGEGDVITLHAVWEMQQYTITYKNVFPGDDGYSSLRTTYTYENNFILVNPQRPGCIFEGWYTDAKFTPSKRIERVDHNSGNLTLYAKWSGIPAAYTVVFDANGGTGTMNAQVGTPGKLMALTANGFKRAGYTFAGWTDAGGAAYANKAKVSFKGGTTVTLKACWKPVTYKLTYKNVNAAEISAAGLPLTFTPEDHLVPAEPYRPGCTFVGWFADSRCTKVVTSIPAGTVGNLTLYAKWSGTPVTYSIVFDGNGAPSGSMKPMTGKKAGALITLSNNAFKYKGMNFAGWLDPATGTLYSNKEKVSNLCSVDGGTVTLVAQWEAIEYTITYVNVNDYNRPAKTTYTVLDGTIRLENLKKTDQVFLGWYTSPTFKESTRITEIPAGTTGNLTLYAKWKVNVCNSWS